MVRSRKDKGQKDQRGTRGISLTKKANNTGPKDAVLKEQIRALGGSTEDFELVKNADENIASISAAADPGLSKEVSQFLQELNLDVPEQKELRSNSVKNSKKTQPSKVEPLSVTTTEKISSTTKTKLRTQKSALITDNTSKAPSIASATDAKVELPKKVVLNPKSKFVFPPTSQWYDAIPRLSVSSGLSNITPAQLSSLNARAAQLHADDLETFKTSSSGSSSSSEASFLSKIIQSGTLSDRLSALTLLVQSSPVHNVKALEALKGMSERGKGQGGREESLKALRCIVDWWVGGGVPDRKLKYFRDQPLLHPDVTDQHLILWYFEDWLKKYFFSILQILENLSLDSLHYVRSQTLNLIFILLRDKPEQEQNLLRLLVNKLGDTDKSICSRASYHILQLLQPHAPMKGVVVREMTALVLRPAAPSAAATISAAAAFAASTSQLPANIANRKIRFADDDTNTFNASPATSKGKGKAVTTEKKPLNAHARYYATITFNQVVLTPADRDVALKLIEVYFEMFKELLGEGKISEQAENGEAADGDDGATEVKMDKKGRVFEGKQNKRKEKIHEVKGAAGFGEVEDENSKLISAILTGVNRALPFAKIDAKDVGLLKHIDTLFLVTHKSTFNISLQALLLIQHIAASLSSSSGSSSSASTSKSIVDRYYRALYASLHDERLATSSKQAMYLNLLFKSIKNDAGNLENERIKALVRRFVQVLVSGGNGATEFIAGGLYLLGELFSSIPGLRSMITEVAKHEGEPYDSRKRDPQYAHASSSPLWELTPLLHHYHPTISLHTRQLLNSQPLTASADLSLNTLSHFLDRFVYKNAKKISPDAAKGKGVSAMQPAASGVEGVKLTKGESATNDGLLMNEEKFLRKRPEDVPVDQLFFHKYFTRKNERVKVKNADTKSSNEDEEADSEDEDVSAGSSGEEEMDLTGDEAQKANDNEAEDEDEEESSELDEEEIWKAMQASMPKALADDDDLMHDSDADIDDEASTDLGSLDDEDQDDEDAEELSDDELSLVEGSDNDDLISLNGDIPDGLIEYDGSDADVDDAEEWGGIGLDSEKSKKRKRNDEDRKRRKKLKSLPTFATYEDYAKMIEDGPEDNI
ncbi:CBF/Mak21 family-domain-containing protein [Lentinula detonsa]|uniref:CBF/Mak21 family-domain-containing protein n=1 Tax=Lentinula detonsa TaxID=2804962 RepID=A0AA38PWQ5_9AGAR|nr:CBF/Mak21 family-domain-containing protein [Lentinula detonsa]